MSDELDIDYTVPAVIPDNSDEAEHRVEWHARMVRHYAAQLEQETRAFRREIDRLKGELEQRERAVQTRIDWHTAPIESYHRMRQREDPAYKTLRLPHATSKITVPKQPTIDYNPAGPAELDQLINWLVEYHPSELRTPSISTLRSLTEAVEVEQPDGTTTYIVIDRNTRKPVPGLTAEVKPPSYKLTPIEGAPL